MHTVERELIKAAGYKVQRKFSDRQDYLKSIINAVSKLEEDDFNVLTDAAADWANAAVEAINAKDEIPDFDEKVDASEDDDEPEEAAVADSGDAENGADDDEEDDDSSDDGDEPADDVDDVQAVDEKPEEKPVKKPKKAAKPLKEVAEKPVKGKRPPQFDQGDVVLDKWGAMDGSKNSQALAMFEKGATSKEVKDELGGTYYNILKKAVENGHKLEKEGALVKLTHSSDLGKKPAKKAKK